MASSPVVRPPSVPSLSWEDCRLLVESVVDYAIFMLDADVLVSDIGMPEEDGYSFIRRIRALPGAEGGKIPALALTAFAREQDRSKSLSAGYTTHIGKPVNAEALVAAVGNLAAIRHRIA